MSGVDGTGEMVRLQRAFKGDALKSTSRVKPARCMKERMRLEAMRSITSSLRTMLRGVRQRDFSQVTLTCGRSIYWMEINQRGKVLEMIGTVTLEGSLQCAKQGGIVCMTGIVGNK